MTQQSEMAAGGEEEAVAELPKVGQEVFIRARPGHRSGRITRLSRWGNREGQGTVAVEVRELNYMGSGPITFWWAPDELELLPHEHEWLPRTCGICKEQEAT